MRFHPRRQFSGCLLLLFVVLVVCVVAAVFWKGFFFIILMSPDFLLLSLLFCIKKSHTRSEYDPHYNPYGAALISRVVAQHHKDRPDLELSLITVAFLCGNLTRLPMQRNTFCLPCIKSLWYSLRLSVPPCNILSSFFKELLHFCQFYIYSDPF